MHIFLHKMHISASILNKKYRTGFPIRYHKYIFSFYLVIYFLISQYAFQSQIFQNILVKYLFFSCSSASWRDAAKKILVIRMFPHFRRCADNLRSFFGEITDFNMILIKCAITPLYLLLNKLIQYIYCAHTMENKIYILYPGITLKGFR